MLVDSSVVCRCPLVACFCWLLAAGLMVIKAWVADQKAGATLALNDYQARVFWAASMLFPNGHGQEKKKFRLRGSFQQQNWLDQCRSHVWVVAILIVHVRKALILTMWKRKTGKIRKREQRFKERNTLFQMPTWSVTIAVWMQRDTFLRICFS